MRAPTPQAERARPQRLSRPALSVVTLKRRQGGRKKRALAVFGRALDGDDYALVVGSLISLGFAVHYAVVFYGLWTGTIR